MKNFHLIVKLIIVFVSLLIISAVICFSILPPQVITALSSPLTIRFDKPVKRQSIQHFISPQIYGEWRFEDPLIKNHLFRTLVFTPAVDFEPNTKYQIKLKNIVNPSGLGLSNSFSFNFKTKALSLKENFQAEVAPNPEKITIIDIPLDWQDHSLSCEAASLKMALNGKGIYISEDDIMGKIGYDPTPHLESVWGDPNRAFVGNIDGKMVNTGYGVHWEPVANAANNWRPAEAFSDWNLKNIIKEIELGNPIIVWGVLPVKTLRDYFWYTPEGKYIKTFRETHVRLVIGFIGEPNNPSKIIINDPLSGRLYWPTEDFLTNWKALDNSGVVVR